MSQTSASSYDNTYPTFGVLDPTAQEPGLRERPFLHRASLPRLSSLRLITNGSPTILNSSPRGVTDLYPYHLAIPATPPPLPPASRPASSTRQLDLHHPRYPRPTQTSSSNHTSHQEESSFSISAAIQPHSDPASSDLMVEIPEPPRRDACYSQIGVVLDGSESYSLSEQETLKTLDAIFLSYVTHLFSDSMSPFHLVFCRDDCL